LNKWLVVLFKGLANYLQVKKQQKQEPFQKRTGFSVFQVYVLLTIYTQAYQAGPA